MSATPTLLSSSPSPSTSYVPNHLIVSFAPGTSKADQASIIAQQGLTLINSYDSINAVLVDTSRVSSSLSALEARLEANAKVKSAEGDAFFYAQGYTGLVPNDPLFPQQWGLHNGGQVPQGNATFPVTGVTTGVPGDDIKAPEAWNVGVGTSDVVVAVIDTGVDYTHPDLINNMWVNPGDATIDLLDNDNNGFVDDVHGINAVTGALSPGDPLDDHGHGTHVAGIIAAQGDNGIGVSGVSWNAKIMAVKVLNAAGAGTTAQIVAGINYVTMMKLQHNVNIVAANMSLGGGPFSQAMQDAVQAMIDAGIVPVAAAGNNGTDNDNIPVYPANFPMPELVSVAATDKDDSLGTFSDYGATTVDIAAPGVDILSTLPRATATNFDPSGYALFSGTSMAAPYVSGAIAVLRSIDPSLTVSQTVHILYAGVDLKPTVAGKVATNGRLNLYNCVNQLTAGSVTGVVWNDANRDGQFDSTELGLSGWKVYLDQDNDGMWDNSEPTTLTNADPTKTDRFGNLMPIGGYQLMNLRGPGTYTVRVIRNGMYTETSPSDGLNSQLVTFETRDSVVTDVNFGYTAPPGTISGIVWENSLASALLDRPDPTEKGLANWIVFADLDGDLRLDVGEPNTKTDTTGKYTLKNVPSGAVIISEVLQSGWVQNYPGTPLYQAVTLLPGQIKTNVNFGNIRSTSLYDFGNAPKPYPTLDSENGAKHKVLSGLSLGPTVTGEVTPNRYTSGGATDADNDGVSFTSELIAGSTATVDVTVTLSGNPTGLLQGWIDFNGNGSWADPGDQIFKNVPLGEGVHSLTFPVPADATPGTTWARFRYGYENNLSYDGASYVGEVEDYAVNLQSDTPVANSFSYAVQVNSVNNIINLLQHVTPSSSGLANIQVTDVTYSGPGTVLTDYASGVVRYTPAANSFAADSFTYTVTDIITNKFSTGTVTITVAPTALDDSLTIINTNGSAQLLDVLKNDLAGSSGLPTNPISGLDKTGTLGAVQLVPATGSATQMVRYTPPAGTNGAPFKGTDQFRYTITDINNVTSTATVTVHMPPEYAKDRMKFWVVVTDTSGTESFPKDVNGNYQVPAGSEFWVQIKVQDMRVATGESNPLGYPALDAGLVGAERGVFSAYADLLYDRSVVSYAGTTAQGPKFPSGIDVRTAIPGLIDELGGFQDVYSNALYYSSVPVLLFTGTFKASATATGTTTFYTDPADFQPLHESALIKPAQALGIGQIEFGTTGIVFTAAAPGAEGELTNPTNPFDVNGDGSVSPVDVLLEVNYVNTLSTKTNGLVPGGEGEAAARYYYDVNADRSVSPLDVLAIINHLNAKGPSGEGEGVGAIAPTIESVASSVVTTGATSATLSTNASQTQSSTLVTPTTVAAATGGQQQLDLVHSRSAAEQTGLESILSDDLAADVLAGWGT